LKLLALVLVAIRCLGGELQLIVDLIQQFFGSLRVTLQIPFVGLLCGNDLCRSLLA